MKKILYILLFFPLIAVGQDQNYTKKTTYKKPVTTSPTNPDLETAVVEITYFDGLGNPIQKIAHGQSNEDKDIITHIEYDVFGRQVKEYLPYPSTQSNMLYVAGNIAKAKTDEYYQDVYEDTNPYSEKLLETSPLSRAFKQSAPGGSWAMGSGHEIRLDYQANGDSEVKYFKATATWNATLELYNNIGITDSGYYDPNELYKTITKDENWTSGDNNTTQEFKNKEGQVVLKRTFNNGAHDTYYVYDQFGNLTYVIPPLAQGVVTETVLNGLCYQYKYDSRNRMAAKKLPGKQWEFIIYNKLDMPTATGPVLSPFGDGTYGWLVTKYEPLGRVAYTGWYDGIAANENGRKTFQTNQNNSPGMFEIRMAYNSIVDGVAINYSDKAAFPLGDFKLLTVNYYDDYNYPNAPTDFSGTEGPLTTTPLKGLATGSWVRVLTSPSETYAETSYTLYDSKYRPIRTHTTNHLGGYTRVDSKLDFAGKTEYTYTRHKRLDSDSEMVVNDLFTYNAQDRLVLHKHQMNGIAEQLIARNTYDKLGQLIFKNVGGNDVTGVGLQKVDYKYNIRGWLKKINDTDNLSQSTDPLDLFAFTINYQDNDSSMNHGVTGNVSALYNGNISETFWRTSGDNVLRKYGYTYDKLNRLLTATYQKPESSSPLTDSYNESLSYDKNGNILYLSRTGEFDDDTYALPIDELTYSYDPNKPNQLMKVFDGTNNPKGFDDDSNGLDDVIDDYAYDANGNMVQDDNKNIKGITYNHQNLPTRITFYKGEIDYIYNALGQKVKKIVGRKEEYETVPEITDYLAGGFQYKEGLLLFFPHAEGYVNITDGKTEEPNYVFNYTDHLGNVRVSYGVDPSNSEVKTLEESNYYPFGLKHNNYNVDKKAYYTDGLDNLVIGLCESCPKDYKYKYNGKELQDELGLNWYDYQARNYDPALGRWMNVDPLAEIARRWSPYNYTYNNPLRFTDPDGMVPEDYRESEAATAPDDWIKNKTTGDVVWRANVTSAANTPQGYDYVGKDYNGLSIQSYTAHTQNGVGVEIQASYSDGKTGTANSEFVQTITTNAPLGGATSPYNDPQPADDSKPFYWTDAELPQYQNNNGQDLDFYDRPTRDASQTGTTWEGELTLAVDGGQGFKPVATVTYGFEVRGGAAVPNELKVSTTESAFQTKTINDYNQTMVGPRKPDGSF